MAAVLAQRMGVNLSPPTLVSPGPTSRAVGALGDWYGLSGDGGTGAAPNSSVVGASDGPVGSVLIRLMSSR